MYIDLGIWWRICTLAHGERLQARKKARRLAIFWLGSLFILFNNLFLLLDHVLFPGFRRVEVRRPVFVIGNMRSGTTRMHRLLCDDEANTVGMALWEMLFPSVTLRRLVHGFVGLDRVVLRGRVADGLTRLQDRKFAKARRMRQWSLTQPEEDEFVFYHCLRSASLLVLFPYYGHFDDLSWTDHEPEAVRRRMMRFYHRIIQRNLYMHGTHKRYVAKNPTFVAKIRTLRERYPEAQFVYMARNPHEMMASGISLLYKTWQALGRSQEELEKSVALMAEQQLELYEYAMEALAEVPESQVAYVEYGELSREPRAVVERLCEQFGWPVDDAFREHLEREQEQADAGYRSEHRYTGTELGPSAAEIERRLAPLFDRYGWERIAGNTGAAGPEQATEQGGPT